VKFEHAGVETPIEFNAFDITGFSIIGEDSSSDPTGMNVRGVGVYDITSMSLEHFYPFYGNFYSDYLTPYAGAYPTVWCMGGGRRRVVPGLHQRLSRHR